MNRSNLRQQRCACTGIAKYLTRTAVVVAVLAIWQSFVTYSLAQTRVVWELQPYSVRLVIAADDAPLWTVPRLALLQESLRQSTAAGAGRAWSCEPVVAEPALRRRLASVLPTPTTDQSLATALLSQAGAAEVEKVIVVVFSQTNLGLRVEARELDAATQTWGPQIVQAASGPADLERAASAAVMPAFSPLARIKSVTGDVVSLRCRSGNSLLRDARQSRLQIGAVLRPAPLMRGKTSATSTLDATYLVIEEVSGLDAKARVYSRYQHPLASLPGGQGAWLLLEVSPPNSSTELRLVRTTTPNRPLSQFDLRMRGVLGGSLRTLRTDRNGVASIPPDGGLQIVEVVTGRHVWARWPLVPGWQSSVDVALNIDEDMLLAAGMVAGLEARLADVVARREITLARARDRFMAGKPDEARQLLEAATTATAAEAVPLTTRLNAERQKEPSAPESKKIVNELWDEFVAELQTQTAPARVEQVMLELFPPPKPVEPPAAAEPAPVDPASTTPATTPVPATPPATAPAPGAVPAVPAPAASTPPAAVPNPGAVPAAPAPAAPPK